MKHEDLTEKIIGCAYKVYNAMGYGYLESVYEKCFMIELNKEGLSAESQIPVKVFYEGENVGDYIADVIVEDMIIIELKSVSHIVKAHEVQLVNYLTATGIEIGLIINFGPQHVEIKRKLKTIST
jgi:GxxExxY protein